MGQFLLPAAIVMCLRRERDYDYWAGWYCDDCYDWIDINEDHWRLFHIMQMVDKTKVHPLSRLIADDSLGHIIASFGVETYGGED